MFPHRPSYYLLIFLLVLITANLLVLNLKVFLSPQVLPLSQTATSTNLPTPKSFLSPSPQSLSACPASCLEAINLATESSLSRIGAQQQPISVSTSTQSVPYETFVPLGTGSTSSSSWQDITATETIIDASNYANIKEARVIFSLRNPTQNGQVEAELYNVTDNHPVWGSHVVMLNVKEQTITSDKITLSSGAKLYRVRLKSTLSYPAYLDGAKIKISYNS